MSFADAKLARKAHTPAPALRLWGDMVLVQARAHELCGRARRTLALHVMAAAGGGPALWIAPGWGGADMNPEGMAQITSPGPVIFAKAMRADDILWSAEEALKSGAVPVVIADLPDPPGMVPVRRLHLAAEAGAALGQTRPICLLLTPGAGGAPGIESRWQLDPAHRPGRSRWRLERLRARMAPPCGWWLENDALERGHAAEPPG